MINANMAIIINLYSVISTSFALQRKNDLSRQPRDQSVSPWIDQLKNKTQKGAFAPYFILYCRRYIQPLLLPLGTLFQQLFYLSGVP